MADKTCILRERLYVPEIYVSDFHLKNFTHYFEVKDQKRDDRGIAVGLESNIQQVKTHVAITAASGDKYIGFARGNLPKLSEFFGQYDWEDRTVAPPFKSDLAFKKDRHLYTYAKDGIGQQEVVDQFLKIQSGVIKAAPRFGKTICTVFILTKMKIKALIVAHQDDLLRQFYAEFEEFSNLMEIRNPSKKKKDANGHIVGFFSDFKNPEELDVCLLCWQTFASKYGPERIKKYRDTWGIVVADEVHFSGAIKYAGILNNLNGRHRLGLTGTLERVDYREKIVLDIVGPVVAKGLVKQVPCVVVISHTNIPVQYKAYEPLPYLFQRLYNNVERTALIIKQLEEDVKDGFFICIGFHRSSQKQLQHFTDLLKSLGYKAEAFYGGMTRDREEVLKEFKDGVVQVAVCNEAMLTGINVPRWNAYYSMFPTANVVLRKEDEDKELSGNFKQKFDRIRTPFWYSETMQKKVGLIRDWTDKNRLCMGMYKKRLKAYKNQDFQIEEINYSRREKLDV